MEFNSLKEKYHYYRDLTDYKLLPNSYVMVMLDGRSFSHKVKKRFKLPFDDKFINMMNETAKYLCEKVSGCKFAYIQSDEISLILHDDSKQDPFFSNRLCKLLSIISSMATSKFNQLALLNTLDGLPCSMEDGVQIIKDSPLYEFDCKAWVVPNANDAFASILYRQNDCIRNSKEVVTQCYFSHSELHKKNTEEQIEMVKATNGVNWYTDFNDGEKYGRFILRQKQEYPTLNKEGQPTGETYLRHKWVVCSAYPLSNEENKNKLLKYIEDVEPTD